MASAQDNNIVIECSPYGDSETEIVNLKTPSFELIPMGNILDFGNSINIIIALCSIFGACLILLFIITRIHSYVNVIEPSAKDLIKPILNGSYLVLFIIGLILLFTQSVDAEYLTFVYIIFGIAFIFALLLRVVQPSSNELTNELVNVFLPGFMIHNSGYNIPVFLVVFVIFYVILSSIRLILQLKPDEAFSPISLLSSYCLLQGLNYIYSNSPYSNDD